MKYGPLFIYGVAAGNSSEKKNWDVLKIYGALYKPLYGESKLTCCLKFTDGNRVVYKTVTSSQKYFHGMMPTVTRFHLTCPNVMHHKGRVPNGVAVTIDNKTCSESDVTFVEPYFPLTEPNKIALSTKTAYGTIDAETIIEWMEAYKYLGVDKVVSYYMDSINSDALKVLKYYASTGILDLHYYEPAYEGNWQLGDNCIQNYHCERYIVGYTVGNLVLRRRASGALKCDFQTYIRRYTSPNEKFEYGYSHSNAILQFCL